MADLTFLETDSESIHESVILALEQEIKEPLYPGDERRIFGDAMAAVFVAAFNVVNEACKKKMLQYASGETLDALGERYGCSRILPTPAKTTLRFSINEPIPSNIIIPQGTRVTPDNSIYFQTIENAVLQAGDTKIDIEAECTVNGEAYNGYLAGTITQLVDLVPYIDNVQNIVDTYDADDGEPYPTEDDGTGDEHYRERIRLAPKSLSVAGPEAAYEYHAKSADASIADVAILSDIQTLYKSEPVLNGNVFLGGAGYDVESISIENAIAGTDYTVTYENELLIIALSEALESNTTLDFSINRDMAGKILIVPILYGGVIPSEDVISKVYAACSADDVRPMTDQVTVEPPKQITYDIDIIYYTTEAEESDCIESIEGAGGAIAQYIEWQDTKMGRGINPDKLRALCLSPKSGTGCNRIIVNSPSHEELKSIEVASFSGTLTVLHKIEEE